MAVKTSPTRILLYALTVLLVGAIGALLAWQWGMHPLLSQESAEEKGERVVIDLATKEYVSKPVAALEEALKEAPALHQEEMKLSHVETPQPVHKTEGDEEPETEGDEESAKQASQEIKHEASSPVDQEKAPHGEQSKEPLPVAAATSNKPMVAVMIMGLGLSQVTTEDALQLPKEVTLGFSPYAYELEKWVQQAKAKGHELFINIPMEPYNHPMDIAGPYALLSDLSDGENTRRLEWSLKKLPGAIGVYSQPGEKFTSSLKNMRPVFDTLKSRQLLFLYGGGAQNNALKQWAEEAKVSFLVSDSVIDQEITATAIEARLRDIEYYALKQGYVIAIGNPYPVTVNAITQWVQSFAEKNLQLVPISAVVAKSHQE